MFAPCFIPVAMFCDARPSRRGSDGGKFAAPWTINRGGGRGGAKELTEGGREGRQGNVEKASIFPFYLLFLGVLFPVG